MIYENVQLRRLAVFASIVMAMAWLAACGGTGSAAREPGSPSPAAERPASRFLTPPPAPDPVTFPRDEAPHAGLTEWWYYTGHLQAGDGRRFGFEFVVFQALRGNSPPAYAAHFAITDLAAATFHFDERFQVGVQPAAGSLPATLAVGGWTLRIGGGDDQFHAEMPGYTLDLAVRSTKPPALHNEVGYFEWAPATGSYYYSHTRMDASGTLAVDGQPLGVTGQAWMDHQWGNFVLSGEGGWDWLSIQLDDERELMLWQSRDSEDQIIYTSGTLVNADGTTRPLAPDNFDLRATGTWTSPHSGATYPSGWTIAIPELDLRLTLSPVLKDQELRTPNSTQVTYWEGAIDVVGDAGGRPLRGKGYVELTGYADS